ncbi:MAG: XTP/dITP diphosphatase [Candidatus Methanomethyliaceae archaeon]|nr:XTP/dITP diphosphatase [Candidatus Methanomethyliaceae archaeon]MDW7970397.1 XTP/dITP diphosphatase [Nitrososphaerota archaeon]
MLADTHKIFFITNNDHKVKEANRILSPFGIELIKSNFIKLEIQSKSLKKIAKYAALFATKRMFKPVIVEDSGLFIKALKGFPGPFSSYVYDKLGCEGILKLMNDINDRTALFKCVVSFCQPNSKPIIFEGIVYGEISFEIRGNSGFGFDPIFIPKFGNGLTFSEMPPEDKDRLSHRGKAFRKFGEWYISNILNLK